MLSQYWEWLFHARVHRELDARRAAGRLGPDEIARRVAEIGNEAFGEIHSVLLQERFLLPPYDDASVYVEFAAVYLGMRYFKPFLLCSFFPALPSLDEVDKIIAQDIDAGALLDATRLPGTPEPGELREAARKAAEAFDADPLAEVLEHPDEDGRRQAPYRIPAGQRSAAKYENWSQRAARHAARGNLAGAIARRARAEAWAPRESAATAAKALREEVHHFVQRLQAALKIEDDDPRPWREALLALAHQIPRGLWTVEARLLYDLQKACIDQERATSTVDVMHWILSFGRRAICRDLPDQRQVAMSRHLRSAERRLARVRISDRQRRQLAKVLGAVTEAAEDRLRTDLRPRIAATLDEIDLRPKNLPEEVSRRKIVEELLDGIVERGFLTLGEVRDAISRNHLKEPDCSGPKSFLRGEAALRANRRLTDALDGVYEPGDFYSRWILRLSHVMFGTRTGRFLTLFLIIPYGVPFAAFVTLDHLMGLFTRNHPHFAPVHGQIADFVPLVVSGVLLQLLIYIPWLRRAIWQGLKRMGSAFKTFVLPGLDKIFSNVAARLIARLFLRPIVPTLILAAMYLHYVPARHRYIGLACIYLGVMAAINSRIGRDFEEAAWDATAEGWQRFGWRPMVGLFWLTVDLFRRFLQGIERVLYTVDEWLRFRSGQGRAMLIAKGAMGVGWFFAAYFVRFCVNLLVEPQVNPLKHFPWVTAAHKMMWPLFIASGLKGFLDARFGDPVGDSLFVVIGTAAPGIFGFLIWELKENWRLFAANRPKNLPAAIIGGHGETMLRLLRPGFHSGTIPKTFAKLRRAERKALGGADPGAARKQREALHHVEIYLRRYVEREFTAWFVESCGWTGPPPQVGEVHLATEEAAIEVEFPQPVEGPVIIKFRLCGAAAHRTRFSGRLCSEVWPTASRDVLRLTIINVLKTASAEKFARCDEPSSADGASHPMEVGTMVVTWDDWVAAWEDENDAGKTAAWDLVSPRSPASRGVEVPGRGPL